MDNGNDPPASHLAGELVRELEQLLTGRLDESARPSVVRALQRARTLHEMLLGPPVETVDRTVFDTLMEIAGPETADQLLHQVEEDLRRIETTLVSALPRQDWAALRAQSHVLLSVTGALGAMPLYHLSQRLNEIVHAQDAPALVRQGTRLLAALDDLLVFVRGHSTQDNGPRSNSTGPAPGKAL